MIQSETMTIETNVSLRILGEKLDPDEVTRELGIPPDESHRKGEVLGKRTPLARKQGYWAIVSSDHIDATAETNEHIRWLVASLGPRIDLLREYRSRGWIVDVWLGIHSTAGHGGPTLEPNVLASLAGLGFEVNLDLYPNATD